MATEGDYNGASSAAHRVYRRSQSERRGGGQNEAPAPATLFGRAVDRYKRSVWAPVASKALGILAGMIALAGIGASSLARGSATPVPSALPAAEVRAQMGASGAHDEQRSGTPRASETTGDAGAGERDASSDAGERGASSSSPGLTADGRVILNLARFEDLRTLSGIGPKKAQAILDLRARLGGRFRRINDLLRVKGIGPKTLAKLKDKLLLDPPPAPAPAPSRAPSGSAQR